MCFQCTTERRNRNDNQQPRRSVPRWTQRPSGQAESDQHFLRYSATSLERLHQSTAASTWWCCPLLGLKRYFRPPQGGCNVFNWVISSDLLPLNDPETPTLLHRSTGSHPLLTFLLLPFQSNPKTVYSVLRSIAGSPSSSSSSPNFPNCYSPSKSASVHAAYLRSHFSVSQPKTLHSRARGYLSEALLACPPFPPWNLRSFTVESTLTSPCSRSDPPLSRQGAALAQPSLSPPS